MLDVVLERQPGVEPASALWAAIENGRGRGLIPAHGVMTIFDLLERARDIAFERRGVERLLSVFDVAAIDGASSVGRWSSDGLISRTPSARLPPRRPDARPWSPATPNGFPDLPVPVVDPPGALSWILGA